MLALLKDKVYIRYWLAVVVSFLGDAMTITAVLFVIGSSTSNPILISLVFVAQLLPGVILGPLIGPLIEKYSSRWVMFWSDIFRFFILLCMMISHDSPYLLIFLVCLLGLGTAFFEPARMASIPTIVGIHRIPEGIALFQTTLAVIKFTGPIFAGVLLAFQSITIVLFLDAISYMLSSIFIISLTVLTRQEAADTKHTYRQQLLLGIVEMFRIPILLFLIILLVPVMISSGVFFTNYKAVLLQVFHLTNVEFGLVEGFFAFGTVCGAIIGSYLIKKIIHYKLLYSSIGTLGLCIIFVFIVDKLYTLDSQMSLVLLIVWSFTLGLTNAVLMVPTSTLFLQHIPEIIRGRGTAIFYSFFNLFLLTGTIIGGVIGSAFSIIFSLQLSGAMLILTALTYPIFTQTSLLKKIIAEKSVML
ncbi:MFS transporter [Metabacillus litoralis]|uniref:MFS transporter n=1 Tax=Metabacillus litoralis TaxID=152268 RepID=UPI001CFF2779|nr:MFS transporter [Metabacillus litoralis]